MPSVAKRVYVIHGGNDRRKEEVVQVLKLAGLVPVLVHERPTASNPVISQFTDYTDANVSFAVVLLTRDDVGFDRFEDPTAGRGRATQNVVLELGYFLARLAPSRILALFEPGIQLPTDYIGVPYVEMDPHGDWQVSLLQRLKIAGVVPELTEAGLERQLAM